MAQTMQLLNLPKQCPRCWVLCCLFTSLQRFKDSQGVTWFRLFKKNKSDLKKLKRFEFLFLNENSLFLSLFLFLMMLFSLLILDNGSELKCLHRWMATHKLLQGNLRSDCDTYPYLLQQFFERVIVFEDSGVLFRVCICISALNVCDFDSVQLA